MSGSHGRWMEIMGRISTVVFICLLFMLVVGLPLFGAFEANFAAQEAAHNRLVQTELLHDTAALKQISSGTHAAVAVLKKEVEADSAYGSTTSVVEITKLEAEIDAICKAVGCSPVPESPGA